MKRTRLICALLLIGASAYALRAQRLTVETAPPVVVETAPRAGADGVDPTVTEIRVTFSKDMMTEEMWSVVKVSDDTFPEITGKVRYEDTRTFVIPVVLEPGTNYAIWFNYKQNDAFRDAGGNVSIPYFLVFKTRE